MQSALLYRFQAAMMGAIVGEAIGIQASGRVSARRDSFEFMRFYAESLINPSRTENPSDPIFRESLTTAESAIALLPVFLFFHEDFPKLRQNVEAVLKLWQNPAVSELDLLAIGYTFSQALLESLTPRRFVSSMFEALLAPPEGIPKLQRLQQVETMIQQGIGLEDATQLILTLSDATTGDAAIALALYCFLSTPGDFRISIQRAIQTRYQVPGVAALTGALSGVYNSTIGLPAAWRMAVTQQTEIQQLSKRLLASWSGMYSIEERNDAGATLPIGVAAPQVMRKI
ncbi:ADP-ribosylglycohydrolase family protein [Pseudanabaenaceae cyanobacterium LEGE 13415]|nr:ADP-ribosylglycohydrolase family protein [Pseudanabaenaceae cyanobacterium LEGE 13415]